MFVFSHIPKTAGTSLVHILKRHFGVHLLSGIYRDKDATYKYQDLKKDLKIHPRIDCLSGHCIKPFIDFKEYEQEMTWFTFLREPKNRFISHYIHQFNIRQEDAFKLDFIEWGKKYNRKNWMVRMIAGSEDLEAAKQILTSKFKFVGFTEEFDESLPIMKKSLGLKDMDIHLSENKMVSSDTVLKEKIKVNSHLYNDFILEQNALDLELYKYAKETIWTKEKSLYPATEKDQVTTSLIKEEFQISSYTAYRNLIYKPYVKFFGK